LLGMPIGQAYNGTVLPLVAGFALLCTFSLGICWRLQKFPNS